MSRERGHKHCCTGAKNKYALQGCRPAKPETRRGEEFRASAVNVPLRGANESRTDKLRMAFLRRKLPLPSSFFVEATVLFVRSFCRESFLQRSVFVDFCHFLFLPFSFSFTYEPERSYSGYRLPTDRAFIYTRRPVDCWWPMTFIIFAIDYILHWPDTIKWRKESAWG